MPRPLGPTFSFLPGWQKLSGSAVLPWPKSKEARRGPAGAVRSPLFLLPPPPEGRDAASSGEAVQRSIPLPRRPPRLGDCLRPSFVQDRYCMEKSGFGFHPGKMLHISPAAWEGVLPRCRAGAGELLGTIWRPSGPAPLLRAGSAGAGGSGPWPVGVLPSPKICATLHLPPKPRASLLGGARAPRLPGLRMLVLREARCKREGTETLVCEGRYLRAPPPAPPVPAPSEGALGLWGERGHAGPGPAAGEDAKTLCRKHYVKLS